MVYVCVFVIVVVENVVLLHTLSAYLFDFDEWVCCEGGGCLEQFVGCTHMSSSSTA